MEMSRSAARSRKLYSEGISNIARQLGFNFRWGKQIAGSSTYDLEGAFVYIPSIVQNGGTRTRIATIAAFYGMDSLSSSRAREMCFMEDPFDLMSEEVHKEEIRLVFVH